MRQLTTFLLFLIFLLPIFSCNSDELFRLRELDREEDYLVFGTVAGYCEEGIKYFYLLTEDALRISSEVNQYETKCKKVVFVEIPMSSEDFEIALPLFDVPEIMKDQLLETSNFDYTIADGSYYWAGRIDGKSFDYEDASLPSMNAHPDFVAFFELFIDAKAKLLK